MYKKLVRDNIPDIIKNNGEIPVIRILSDEEYKIELEKKLLEEYKEVIESFGISRIEELGDMLEVMISLSNLEGKNLDDIIEISKIKRLKNGGFNKKIYLEDVKKCD